MASCDFLPIRNEAFYTCSLMQVIGHLYFPTKTVREVHRILKFDGKLILTTLNFADFSNRINVLIGNIIPGMEQSLLLRFFTWKSLNIFLRKHGFKLEKRRKWFIPFPLMRIIYKFPAWRKAMTLPAKVLPNYSDSLMGEWRKI